MSLPSRWRSGPLPCGGTPRLTVTGCDACLYHARLQHLPVQLPAHGGADPAVDPGISPKDRQNHFIIDFLQKSHFYLAQGGVPAAGDRGGALMRELQYLKCVSWSRIGWIPQIGSRSRKARIPCPHPNQSPVFELRGSDHRQRTMNAS
ncbi:MAG: hypothetical protein MZV64_59660 [Ignavibacteriales bacterium]|nr:hypothetical protein [Ignavibacteriales bacterium]